MTFEGLPENLAAVAVFQCDRMTRPLAGARSIGRLSDYMCPKGDRARGGNARGGKAFHKIKVTAE
jgi:hypothetical protein